MPQELLVEEPASRSVLKHQVEVALHPIQEYFMALGLNMRPLLHHLLVV